MDIAFCINRLGMIGLGVTLSSLIRNCSNQKCLNLWFLCAGLSETDEHRIERLLNKEKFTGNHHFIRFDPISHFGSFNSLHGDWTIYGRLLLADYLEIDRVLYLDSDLVIELDILEINSFDFYGYPLAAVGGGRFRYTLGNQFYINKLGLSPDLEYFNSGVLLLDLKRWRKEKIKEKCLKIANKYPRDLPSHDQSVLNVFCEGNFAKLPKSFNCEWQAHLERPQISKRMIFHFVGSPKPWDPFGFFLNNGYSTYRKYLNPEWTAEFGGISSSSFRRVWNIRRSYLRCIQNKINS